MSVTTPKHLRSFFVISTFVKLLLNISKRLVYPFAPEISRGLGLSLPSVTSVIAIGQATSALGPVGASFADRYGYRLLMLYSIGMMIIGTFALGVLPIYAMFVICVLLTSLAKNIFDPSFQALIGKLVSYEKRGRIIGLTELAWAGSTLIGIPAAGIIIEKFSWQTPFLIISILSIISFFVLLKLIPKPEIPQTDHTNQKNVLAGWKHILKNRKVLRILLFVFFISIANDNLFVIYGVWLEATYQLSLAAIGAGTILIGMAELAGEGLTATLSDRIGLKKSLVFSVLFCSLAYFIFPLLDTSLAIAMAGIFLIFSSFEFTMVTAMSLSTELVPDLRASTMSAFFATAGLGRMAGAFSGSLIWSTAKTNPLFYICIISGVCMLSGLFCLIIGSGKKNIRNMKKRDILQPPGQK